MIEFIKFGIFLVLAYWVGSLALYAIIGIISVVLGGIFSLFENREEE